MATVGGYEILEPISRGAMGAVHRARGADGREVALKRMIAEGERERFEIEVRLLSGLRHPRVVEVLGQVGDEGGEYLVMELVRGRDLGRVLEAEGRPGLAVERALEYARQTCEALQYVHEQQIVHRDVKPANLVLGEDGVVLVDFGIARELQRDAPGTRGVGTPLYIAPEVLVGEAVSPRSDVFGLAATVWTLIAGRPPGYRDQTPLADRVAAVSPALEATLRRGLELHPERRFGSAAAFAAALGSPLEAMAGEPLVASLPGSDDRRELLEAVVRTAAGVFEAAAASLALVDEITGELVYAAAWGAGAAEIVGARLEQGGGIAGAAVAAGRPVAVSRCRDDERFEAQIAAGTGYVPHTMIVVPLARDGAAIGALSLLDRRDGRPYGESDVPRAELFSELALAALGD